MSGSSFRELLSKPTNDFKAPPVLADGHYIGSIPRHEFGRSKNKQTPYLRVYLKPTEATEDVEADANASINLNDYEVFRDFYITPKSLFMITRMLDAVLGESTGRSFDERIPELNGVSVMFQVSHRNQVDDDGNIINSFNDVGTIVAA